MVICFLNRGQGVLCLVIGIPGSCCQLLPRVLFLMQKSVVILVRRWYWRLCAPFWRCFWIFSAYTTKANSSIMMGKRMDATHSRLPTCVTLWDVCGSLANEVWFRWSFKKFNRILCFFVRRCRVCVIVLYTCPHQPEDALSSKSVWQLRTFRMLIPSVCNLFCFLFSSLGLPS